MLVDLLLAVEVLAEALEDGERQGAQRTGLAGWDLDADDAVEAPEPEAFSRKLRQ